MQQAFLPAICSVTPACACLSHSAVLAILCCLLNLQTVALDPRYGSRKTREFVYGTAAGSLALCSKVGRPGRGWPSHDGPPFALPHVPLWQRFRCRWQHTPATPSHPASHCNTAPQGWLGSKETVLFRGKGAVRCARMAGTLLAWATDSGLR